MLYLKNRKLVPLVIKMSCSDQVPLNASNNAYQYHNDILHDNNDNHNDIVNNAYHNHAWVMRAPK